MRAAAAASGGSLRADAENAGEDRLRAHRGKAGAASPAAHRLAGRGRALRRQRFRAGVFRNDPCGSFSAPRGGRGGHPLHRPAREHDDPPWEIEVDTPVRRSPRGDRRIHPIHRHPACQGLAVSQHS